MVMSDAALPETIALPNAQWAAVLEHDRAADGRFFYSVASTGVYCRPSCPSRRPKREHVRFHASAEDAERAGFRACRRCHPNRPESWRQNSAVVADICRAIQASDALPDLAELAARAGFSAHHFHRMFKAETGMTPRAYARAQRAERIRTGLASGGSVTAALHDAGYGSSSRFYERSNEVLGMKPADYRAGGADLDIRYAFGSSSLGDILIATTDVGICAIFLGDEREDLVLELTRRFPKARIGEAGGAFADVAARIVDFVESPKIGLDLPLDLRGTVFQQRVWSALREIPSGQTMTYGQIAAKIGAPNAVRAVGTACGANPVCLLVPCHRVVGRDGQMHGYRWGVERKRELLKREGTD